MPLTRRRLLKTAFWSSTTLAVTGGIASFVRMLYSTKVEDGVFTVKPEDVPEPGGVAFEHDKGKFLLVHLRPGEGSTPRGDAGPGGLLVLWRRCPHLGCSVRYLPSALKLHREAATSGEVGGIACRCHGGLFTLAGVRVFGPPPRGLDTAACRVTAGGHVLVDMRFIQPGDADNPLRTIPYTPTATSDRKPETWDL